MAVVADEFVESLEMLANSVRLGRERVHKAYAPLTHERFEVRDLAAQRLPNRLCRIVRGVGGVGSQRGETCADLLGVRAEATERVRSRRLQPGLSLRALYGDRSDEPARRLGDSHLDR